MINDGNYELADKVQEVIEYQLNSFENEEMFDKKSKYINAPIDFNNKYTIYINTITKNSQIFPYILVYSNDIKENCEIIMDTLNTNDIESTNNKIDVFCKGCKKISELIKSGVSSPMLYTYIPRKNDKSILDEPYYQQLSRECFTNTSVINNKKRVDLVV